VVARAQYGRSMRTEEGVKDPKSSVEDVTIEEEVPVVVEVSDCGEERGRVSSSLSECESKKNGVLWRGRVLP